MVYLFSMGARVSGGFKFSIWVVFLCVLGTVVSSGWGAVVPSTSAMEETPNGDNHFATENVSAPFDDDSGDSMWESSFLPDPSQESTGTVDQDSGAMEAIVATAKARVILDNPSLSGKPTDFEQIKPYILINGAMLESLEELENKSGRKIVSLGSYPTIEEGGGGEDIVWGEPVRLEGRLEQARGDGEALDDLVQEDPWKSMIGGGDLCLYLPFFTFNPRLPVSVDAQSTRKIIYKTGQPVRIVDLFEMQGMSKSSEFFIDLRADEDASITSFLLALRELGSFPSLDEQFDNTLNGNENWVKARTVTLIWRQPDGEVRTVEILAEVEGSGAREIRGVSYSNDVQWLVDLLGKAEDPSLDQLQDQ